MPTDAKFKKDKTKKHKASSSKTASAPDAGKNEGVDQTWAFQPPTGATAISTNAQVDNGEFDWDAVEQDEDVELWVLRVPDNVKSKHLEGLSFDLPPLISSSEKGKNKTTRVGALQRKHTSYDIWLLGEDDNAETDRAPLIGGEELKSLSCLLPKKSKSGELYPAPKPIARHFLVSAQPPQPSTPDSPSQRISHKNPPRHRYPPELLKHRFVPYGSIGGTRNCSALDEDVAMVEIDSNVPKEAEKEGKEKKKERRGDEDEEMQVDELLLDEEIVEREKKRGKSKKVKVEKMQVDEAQGGSVVKDDKKKSKKRKGGDSQEVEVSAKKSKKAKTTSA